MKKSIILVFISLFVFTSAKQADLDLAIRYIKLGSTYREGKEFDNSAKYLSEGLKIAQKINSFDGKYWTAAAYENLGYLYRDMSMFDESKKNFNLALDIYNKIIRQEDGSQQAMLAVLNKIAQIKSDDIPINFAVSGPVKGDIASLASKKLKELPNDIPLSVKSLVLKDNRFRQFPDGISRFSELEYLDLSDNRLRNISESIGNMKKLHYLDLSNNKIDKIPSSISMLQNLRELNLSGNKLKEVNFNLCGLSNLKILNLRNNKLDYQEVLKLVRCLPNTNILFDKYERLDEETQDDDF